MARHFAAPFIALGALMTTSAVLACSDMGCEGGFNLVGNLQSCQGRAMLAPGNDSRINLLFLLNDRGARSTAGINPAKPDDFYSELGTVFVDWRSLHGALYPASRQSGETAIDYAGLRCMSYAKGSSDLLAAMAANRNLPDAERTALTAARSAAEEVCKQGTSYERRYGDKAGTPLPVYAGWPAVSSPMGREFLVYIQAADAFYGERWDAARTGITALANAGDPFVKETAAYLLIRVEFAAAQAAAFDKYGDFTADQTDRAAARRGMQALSAYLGAYPKGRYAASASGLVRRGLWLMGDYALLSKTYGKLLGTIDPARDEAVELVQEVDNKLLFNPAAKGAELDSAMLLAAQLLVAMRDESYGIDAAGKPNITAAALDAQEPRFAGQPDLFSYLQATHAFYYGRDYKRVLQLLPDDARRTSHTNLSFSRQMLRGMALAALKDRNEAGFWQELIPNAKGLWQRPLAELGLALSWERGGKVDAVFAAGSPVTDPSIRSNLIHNSAAPALLRSIVRAPANSATERDEALYTLLSNQLVRGQYAAFGADVKLPLVKDTGAAMIFTSGKVSDGGYPCAPLAVTVAALAKNPQDMAGRLCLSDFFRLHGLDYMHGKYDRRPKPAELGGTAAGFTGKRNFRSEFYTAIIADPKAGANDKAYALYRSVMCYAPSAMNDCGGADVTKAQRKAWYDQLKRDHPQSQWAKKLRYYW
jgi:hypothetical protein